MSGNGTKLIARIGYGARAVVYLIVGSLACVAAFGAGGETTGSRGALFELLHQPFGAVLLGFIALGLFCYSAWRTVQALLDADDHGTDAKAIVIRAALLVSATTHLLLALYAVSLIFNLSGSGDRGSGSEVSWLMRQPLGPYLVAAAGVLIIGAGVAQFWKGVTGKFHKHFEFSRTDRPIVSAICTFGLCARSVVFCIAGGLFLFAAYNVEPSQAGGLKESLQWIQRQPFGTILLAVMSIGLIAFSFYSFIEAMFRKIGMPSELSFSRDERAMHT